MFWLGIKAKCHRIKKKKKKKEPYLDDPQGLLRDSLVA